MTHMQINWVGIRWLCIGSAMTFLRFSENRWGLIMFVCVGIALMMERWAGATAPSKKAAGEAAPLSAEQLKKEWLAQSEILDYSNWLVARIGVLSAKVKELEAKLYDVSEELSYWTD